MRRLRAPPLAPRRRGSAPRSFLLCDGPRAALPRRKAGGVQPFPRDLRRFAAVADAIGEPIAVIPGHTLTPLVETMRQDPDVAGAIDARIPLGRPGTTAELTGLYVFLAGDESRYCTGGLFTADGGMTTL